LAAYPDLVTSVICSRCDRANAADARFCNGCGAALERIGDGASRRTVTVLFCDLAGSTALGDRLDPEALRGVMTAYHARMRDAVERHGGTVEKFIGDAVMAVFGLPDLHEDDALRAVRAAEEMRSALVELSEQPGATRLAGRMGVNTGEVVIGEGEVLVTGDAVNVAARLEQAAEADEVLLGDPTERLVRGAVETGPPRVVEAKGKALGLTAHPLVRVVPGADPLARRRDAPLVGREDELALLQALYDRTARVGGCHLVAVLGPAGIGKTRLAEELLARVPEARALWGRCLPYGEGITYWPLAEALDLALGDDPMAEVGRLMAGRPDGERIARIVASALGREAGDGGQEIPWAVRRVLERLGEDGPVVLVLDDAQWAEPAMHELIDHLAAFARAAPLMVLCLARPELFDVRPSWAMGAYNGARLLLESLTSTDARALVERLADGALGEAVCGRIVETAEGNPLFAEQLLAVALEDGAGSAGLPPTIRALLAARIDRLPPPLRSLVEHAAVEGKMFHLGALRAVLPERESDQLEQGLDELVRADLVRPALTEAPGEVAYAFRHLLIRDVAYERLSKERRADVHEQLASWLADRGPMSDEICAHHLEEAWQLRVQLDSSGATSAAAAVAADALATVGRRAAERGDVAAAANLLTRPAAAGGGQDPGGVWVELINQRIEGGDFDRVAEAIAHLADVEDDLAGAYADIARFQLDQLTNADHDFAEGAARAAAAVELFALRRNDRGLARAWLSIAEYHDVDGRHEASHDAHLEALAAARRAGDRAQEARVAADIPITMWFGPTPVDEILTYVGELLDASDTARPVRAEALLVRGAARAASGDVEAGRADATQARSMRAELGQLIGWAVTAQIAALVELLAGDPERAEALLREGSDQLLRLGEASYLSTNEGMRALILVDLGRMDEAAQAAQVSRRSASPSDIASQALWRCAEALLLSREGRHSESVALAREAAVLLEPTDAIESRAHALMVLGRVLGRAGNLDAARHEVATAAGLYDRKGFVRSAAEARELLVGLARADPLAPRSR
jgi:class 3 adenylate cyclase/tetratricopeptide (TPR) repeat protein